MSVHAPLQSRAPLVGQFALWVLTVSVVALAMQPPPGHHLLTLARDDSATWVVAPLEANATRPPAIPSRAQMALSRAAAPASTPSPTASPTPTPSPSPTASPTPTPSPSTTAAATPTPSLSTDAAATPTPSPTASPTPTSSPTPEPVAAEPACESEAHVCRGQRLWGDLDRLLPAEWEIRFEPGRRGILGWADSRAKRLTIYMRTSASDELLSHVMLHELGHAHDFAYLGRRGRARWMEARALSGNWFPCSGCDDRGSPAGDWAESFAVCVSGVADHFESRLGPPPSAEQCRVLHELAGP